MGDFAEVTRSGRRHVVALPEGIDLEDDRLLVRREGRNLVLAPVGASPAIQPGAYTAETLPPLSEAARAILASVDAAVARLGTQIRAHMAAAKSREAPSGTSALTLEDDGQPGTSLADEGRPGFDPDS